MSPLQEKILEVFTVFKSICDKHNLKYFAIGGTCIGAIRHHGFIPWDDDLDVAMPINDYLRFFRIAEKELKNTKYEMIDCRMSQHDILLFNKLYDASTTMIEDLIKPYPDRYIGIFIDIFPVCGFPKTKQEQKSLFFWMKNYNRADLRLRLPYSYHPTAKWKLPWLAVQPIKAIKKFDYFSDKRWKLIKKQQYNESEQIYFPWRGRPNEEYTYKDVFIREDFENPIEVKFENTTMCVPNGYDRYLTMDFGDYMKLPPKEKQVGNHSAYIDFHKSYRYYANLAKQGKLDFAKQEEGE